MNIAKIILGKDPALKSLLRCVKIIAATDVNVLITGETGTGKELIAEALQKNSKRADQVFITLNCAALSQSLMESALFGYRKGAFTDANADTPGLFEAAPTGMRIPARFIFPPQCRHPGAAAVKASQPRYRLASETLYGLFCKKT